MFFKCGDVTFSSKCDISFPKGFNSNIITDENHILIDLEQWSDFYIELKKLFLRKEYDFFSFGNPASPIREGNFFEIENEREKLQFVLDLYDTFPEKIHEVGLVDKNIIKIIVELNCSFTTRWTRWNFEMVLESHKKITILYCGRNFFFCVYNEKKQKILDSTNFSPTSILYHSGELHYREKEKIRESILSNKEYLSFISKIILSKNEK